jgi:hypothetical protein
MVQVANVDGMYASHLQVSVGNASRESHTVESFATQPMEFSCLMAMVCVDDWCRLYASGRTGARQRGTRGQWPLQRRSWHQRLHSGSPLRSREPGA